MRASKCVSMCGVVLGTMAIGAAVARPVHAPHHQVRCKSKYVLYSKYVLDHRHHTGTDDRCLTPTASSPSTCSMKIGHKAVALPPPPRVSANSNTHRDAHADARTRTHAHRQVPAHIHTARQRDGRGHLHLHQGPMARVHSVMHFYYSSQCKIDARRFHNQMRIIPVLVPVVLTPCKSFVFRSRAASKTSHTTLHTTNSVSATNLCQPPNPPFPLVQRNTHVILL